MCIARQLLWNVSRTEVYDNFRTCNEGLRKNHQLNENLMHAI